MDNWILKYVHCVNLYDIYEGQAEIVYFTVSTFKKTFMAAFHICLKTVANII